MKLNIANVYSLMQDRFNGNYNAFARTLGVDPSHIHRVLVDGVGGGNKIIGAIIKYCKGNGIDYNTYIILNDGQSINPIKYEKPICNCGCDLYYVKSTESIIKGKIGDKGFITKVISSKQVSIEEWLICENCGAKFEVDFLGANGITKGKRVR
jgi:hypothetical protein